MRRWLLVAAVAAAVWLAWSSWFAPREAEGTGSSVGGATAGAAGTPAGTPRRGGSGEAPPGGVLRRAAPAGSGLESSGKAAAAEDPLLAALQRGEAKAVARALEAIGRAPSTPDPRLLAGLRAVLARAEKASAEWVLERLGGRNAFLFSDIGRRLGERALAAADREPPWRAARGLSRLAEACMNGPISVADGAARTFVERLRSRLRSVLRRTVLDPADHTRARTYKVRPGDVLDRIARRFRRQGLAMEAGTIAFFNRIDDPRRLQPGTTLKVPTDPMRVVVHKDSFLMAVYVGDVVVRLYWVGHGKDDSTPEATFRIGAKRKHPPWYAPGRVVPYGHPDNPLGDYFVKFEHASYTGFGVHGTSEPESIGRRSSRGCIRMRDADIEEFFRIVPRGTEVVIRSSR